MQTYDNPSNADPQKDWVVRLNARESESVLSASSHVGLAVWIALKSFQRANKSCYPSHTTLADKAKASVSSVKRAVSKLQEAGLIRIERSPAPYPNLYFLQSPISQNDTGDLIGSQRTSPQRTSPERATNRVTENSRPSPQRATNKDTVNKDTYKKESNIVVAEATDVNSESQILEVPQHLSNPKQIQWLAEKFAGGNGYDEITDKASNLYKFDGFWNAYRAYTKEFSRSENTKAKANAGNVHEAAAAWSRLSWEQKLVAGNNLKYFKAAKIEEGYGWPHAVRYLKAGTYDTVEVEDAFSYTDTGIPIPEYPAKLPPGWRWHKPELAAQLRGCQPRPVRIKKAAAC